MVKSKEISEQKKKIRERARAKLKKRKTAERPKLKLEDVFDERPKFSGLGDVDFGSGGNTVAPVFSSTMGIEESVADAPTRKKQEELPVQLYNQNLYGQSKMYGNLNQIKQTESGRVDSGAIIPVHQQQISQSMDMIHFEGSRDREKDEGGMKHYEVRSLGEESIGAPGLLGSENLDRAESIRKYRRPDQ